MAWRKRPLPAAEERSADPAKAREKALDWLTARDHSAQQLYDKLRRYYTDEAAAAAVAEMVGHGYLDDRRFAQNKARVLYAQHKSRRAILRALAEKGVDKALADQVVQQLYDEQQAELEAAAAFAPCDTADPETASALALVQKSYRRKLEAGRPDLVLAALQRRGFSYRAARGALALAQAAGTDGELPA